MTLTSDQHIVLERQERHDAYAALVKEGRQTLAEYDAASQLDLGKGEYLEGMAILDRQRSAVFHVNTTASRLERTLRQDFNLPLDLGPYRETIDGTYREELVRAFTVLETIARWLEQKAS